MSSTKKKSSSKIVKKLSKRMTAVSEKINEGQFYKVEEGLALVKSNASAKFNETMEFTVRLGVDPRHADQMVRGVAVMPFGTGKKVRIAVFAQGEKAEEAKKAGADIVGAEDLVKMIQDGNLDFDCCVATPDMMVKVGAVAKILGPKGLMPNPKLGTVTLNITDIINSIRQGQVNFRVEKAGIVHAPFGKVDFELEALTGNLKSLISAIVKSKPTGAKGNYVQAAFLSSTMGGSVKLDVADLLSLV